MMISKDRTPLLITFGMKDAPIHKNYEYSYVSRSTGFTVPMQWLYYVISKKGGMWGQLMTIKRPSNCADMVKGSWIITMITIRVTLSLSCLIGPEY